MDIVVDKKMHKANLVKALKDFGFQGSKKAVVRNVGSCVKT